MEGTAEKLIDREHFEKALKADTGYRVDTKFHHKKYLVKKMTREELQIKIGEYLKGGGTITKMAPEVEGPENYFSLL